MVLFLGLELLSIPLYVLCATEMRREHSLESGLKYLIIGSVGSATLLYGLAMIYGATGQTDFAGIASALSKGDLATDPLTLTGDRAVRRRPRFKASVAPFHQWTPDVYEGAPTPVTAFMAVTTKVAALGRLHPPLRRRADRTRSSWGPALAALATITILVGNVGALGQSSLKRMLAYSSVGQVGYMLAGVVVATSLGVKATVFYLAVYLFMNMAAFAVIVARERETDLGDSISAVTGLGRERPLLAWPLTIAMLGLAGIPATAGFIGKFYLIDAAVAAATPGWDRDRDRLDDLARLLPAGDRGDVDARGARVRGRRRTRARPAPAPPGAGRYRRSRAAPRARRRGPATPSPRRPQPEVLLVALCAARRRSSSA